MNQQQCFEAKRFLHSGTWLRAPETKANRLFHCLALVTFFETFHHRSSSTQRMATDGCCEQVHRCGAQRQPEWGKPQARSTRRKKLGLLGFSAPLWGLCRVWPAEPPRLHSAHVFCPSLAQQLMQPMKHRTAQLQQRAVQFSFL